MRPDAMPVASEEIAPTHVEHGAHKDVLSILRWCENPGDRVAGFRAVQCLALGPAAQQKFWIR
jgi:hypothetical protein